MGYEVRFYYSKNELNNLIDKLDKIKELKKENKLYEKTMQYDHPSSDISFYSEETDGRFRVRVSKGDEVAKCKLSWKRRIPTTSLTDVNEEEKVELTIKYEEYENLLFIVNNVLRMKSVESYERYRTVYTNDEIEIAVDEYPFGIALEIENKSVTGNPKEIVRKWVENIGLDINNSYKLSWNDKYTELYKEQNAEIFKHVTFDKLMPEVK